VVRMQKSPLDPFLEKGGNSFTDKSSVYCAK
jgi:hypothetical protein